MYFKDLERSIELINNSFQRQLAAEKKKTINSQEEVKILQEELDRLTNKLKVYIQVCLKTLSKALLHLAH